MIASVLVARFTCQQLWIDTFLGSKGYEILIVLMQCFSHMAELNF